MPHRNIPHLLALSFVLLLAALTTGCATTGPGRPVAAEEPTTAAEIYAAGREALDREDYGEAIQHFRALAVNYPDNRDTPQARMELAYAYYRNGNTSSAVAAAERFMDDHPDHPDLDYLYYLRGLANYDRAMAALQTGEAAGGIELPAAELALQHFGALIARFPDSRYSDDARNRITHLKEQLGQRQLRIAKRFLGRGDYAAAGLYARGITDNFPETTAANDAVGITEMAYRMLQLDDRTGKEKEPPEPEIDSEEAGVKDAEWLLQQDPGSYTLQLLSTSDKNALLSFIRDHQFKELAYFTTKGEAQPWHTLVYGLFPSPGDARGAAEKLPSSLRKERPWIRKLSDVQAAIAAARAAGEE